MIMYFVAVFFSGVFICNAIPHLTAGLQGQPFPTPFARPRGVGDSSPILNIVWGAGNAVLGFGLLAGHPFALGFNLGAGAFLCGFLALGFYVARHFGRVRQGRHPA